MDCALAFERCRHAGQAAKPASTQEAEQNGFSLIVGVVRGRDNICAHPPGESEKQVVAGVPRAFLNPGFRLLAAPDKDIVRKPETTRPIADRFGLAGGLPAKAMVDGGDMEMRRVGQHPRPIGGEQH